MALRSELKTVWRHPGHFVACGFGFGLLPIAPGTWGTLPGVVLVWMLSSLSVTQQLLILSGLFLLGVWLCNAAGRAFAHWDHPAIVWDEIVGFAVAMVGAPSGLAWMALGFLFFRLFDIFKPWPIYMIDEACTGGFGVMFDDVLAGVYTLIVIQCLASLGLPLGL